MPGKNGDDQIIVEARRCAIGRVSDCTRQFALRVRYVTSRLLRSARSTGTFSTMFISSIAVPIMGFLVLYQLSASATRYLFS